MQILLEQPYAQDCLIQSQVLIGIIAKHLRNMEYSQDIKQSYLLYTQQCKYLITLTLDNTTWNKWIYLKTLKWLL